MDSGSRREELKQQLGTSLRVLLGLAVMIGSLAFGAWLKMPPPRPNVPAYVRLFGGNEERLAPLKAPSRMEAFRLVRFDEDNPQAGQDYRAEPCLFVIPDKLCQQFSTALTSSELSRIAWRACEADYDVKLAFYRDDQEIDVLLCFDCDKLIVLSGNDTLGTANLTKIRTPIVTAVQELFPQDRKLRTLKTSGPTGK